ncbi:MAG TPA: hypothetical protein VFT67_16680 [Jatrophihabitantaceae bacterium]|nr:hypothetical protein [Jatrophihabitantaceae bacterium]
MSEPVPADELPTAIVAMPGGLIGGSAPAADGPAVVDSTWPTADAAPVADASAAPSMTFGEPAREPVTCPECGTAATIALNRRESSDFCRNCDFPLFWTPSAVLRADSMRAADDALRRLPGTVGRATIASIACPHCAEPNQLSAQVCVRCGRLMQLVEEPPPPAPVYVPPALPAPEPEPQRAIPWWVWLLLGLGVALLVTLTVLAAYGKLG